MGLFEYLRAKLFGPVKPKTSRPDLSLLKEPRCHHYVMAHVILRHMALGDPLNYLEILTSPEAPSFLQFAFDEVCKKCNVQCQPDFSPSDLLIFCSKVLNHPCLIIQMPKPATVVEAHFTALVVELHYAKDSKDNGPPEIASARYFTLERGISTEGKEIAVLCEWTIAQHSIFADNVEPSVDGFVAAIERNYAARHVA